jgi:hypothetical protein
MYPVLCDKHTQPCIECPSCRAWGKAFNEWEQSFTVPVSQHPAVLKAQATEWANKTFGHPFTTVERRMT